MIRMGNKLWIEKSGWQGLIIFVMLLGLKILSLIKFGEDIMQLDLLIGFTLAMFLVGEH